MGILRYTGHPFIDVGVATITAFVDKKYPYEVDEDDLNKVATYLKEVYTQPQFKLFQNLISSVFLNSHFVQHSMKLEQKQIYANEVLFAWHNAKPIQGVNCSFFPEKSAVIYAHRQHIPLLNGNGIANFSPNGIAGLPVSGEALLAIHALPLGCLKCGNFLAFHQATDPLDPKSGVMNCVMAVRAVKENKQAIANLNTDPSTPIPSFGSAIRSRYIDEIIRAKNEISIRESVNDISFITAYSFSNYGPNPRIEIVQLDQMILDFVDTAQQDQNKAWNKLIYSAWLKPKKEQDAEINTENTRQWRNALYESLFDLPQQSDYFLRRFLLHSNWSLITIFLRKVMQMEQERIDVYRNIGDSLAEYMLKYELSLNKFYIPIARAKNYTQLRRIIENAEYNQLKQGAEKPLITFEEFINAFEHPSLGYSQWQLGRDLILMRLREAIYNNRQKFDPNELAEELADLDLEIEEEN